MTASSLPVTVPTPTSTGGEGFLYLGHPRPRLVVRVLGTLEVEAGGAMGRLVARPAGYMLVVDDRSVDTTVFEA